MKFLIGQKVAVYASNFGRMVGEVVGHHAGMVKVKYGDGSETFFCPQQCRRIKPKKKLPPITSALLEQAWINWSNDRKANGSGDFIKHFELVCGRRFK